MMGTVEAYENSEKFFAVAAADEPRGHCYARRNYRFGLDRFTDSGPQAVGQRVQHLTQKEIEMPSYMKQALFILAVVGVAKFVNNALPANPLDKFLPA